MFLACKIELQYFFKYLKRCPKYDLTRERSQGWGEGNPLIVHNIRVSKDD